MRATITITCPDTPELPTLVAAFCEAIGGKGKIEVTGTRAVRAPRPLNDEEQAAADDAVDALSAAMAASLAARRAAAQAAKDAEAAKETARLERERLDAEERERQRLEDAARPPVEPQE